jgi:hypothetical protein
VKLETGYEIWSHSGVKSEGRKGIENVDGIHI